MAEEWTLVAWLIGTTVAIRAAGPVTLGGRALPAQAMSVIALLGLRGSEPGEPEIEGDPIG